MNPDYSPIVVNAYHHNIAAIYGVIFEEINNSNSIPEFEYARPAKPMPHNATTGLPLWNI